MFYNQWWVWGVAGLVLAIMEMLLPAYVFLGFGIGAGLIALMLLVLQLAGATPPDVTILVLVFAFASLASWLVLRKVFGSHKGQVKQFEHDINDN